MLARLKKMWMKFAFGLGWVNTRIILFIFFGVFVGIYAIISKLLSLFVRKKNSGWQDVKREHSLEEMKHQF